MDYQRSVAIDMPYAEALARTRKARGLAVHSVRSPLGQPTPVRHRAVPGSDPGVGSPVTCGND